VGGLKPHTPRSNRLPSPMEGPDSCGLTPSHHLDVSNSVIQTPVHLSDHAHGPNSVIPTPRPLTGHMDESDVTISSGDLPGPVDELNPLVDLTGSIHQMSDTRLVVQPSSLGTHPSASRSTRLSMTEGTPPSFPAISWSPYSCLVRIFSPSYAADI
jgi:hypothetical protein